MCSQYIVECGDLFVMVAPKKVCFKDEDKSPSPEPFEEPVGMVTIDLNDDGSSKLGGNFDI